MKIKLPIVLMIAALIAAGCSAATPAPTPTSTPAPTDTPAPTNTPVPTATATPKPTNTPVPTSTPKPTNTPEPARAAADLSAAKITLEDLPATFAEFPQQQAMADAMEASLEGYGPSAKLVNFLVYASSDAKPQVLLSWIIHPLDEADAAEFDSAAGQPDKLLRNIPGVTSQTGETKIEPLKGSDQLGNSSAGGTVVSDLTKFDVIIMRRGAALAYVLLGYQPTEKPSVNAVKLANALDQRLQDALLQDAPKTLPGLPEATQNGTNFVNAIRDGKFAAAYAMFHPELQKKVGTASDLQKMIDDNKARPKEWDFTSTNTGVDENQNQTAMLEGSVTYEDGRKGAVTLELLKMGNAWKVISFNFTW